MSCFGGDPQIVAWAGLSPGNNESAGKKKSSKIAKGNNSLKAVLCQVALAANKSKGTRLASFFYRIQKRRGQKKATIATAHLILWIIYRMLKDKIAYREVGWDYLTSSTSSVEYWIKKSRPRDSFVFLPLFVEHFDRFGSRETPAPHDQLGTASLVGIQMKSNLAAIMSCLHCRTFAMSVVTEPVITVPNWAALQISFLLGTQATAGHEPRPTGTPRRQPFARIAPGAKPATFRLGRCQGPGFRNVLLEISESSFFEIPMMLGSRQSEVAQGGLNIIVATPRGRK